MSGGRRRREQPATWAELMQVCQRVRRLQHRQLEAFRRAQLITDASYAGLLARGDQLDAAIASLRSFEQRPQ